jgi:hypothetical protein
MFRCSSHHDPGPCPVDDTPHTACTPESVGTVTAAVRRPRVLDRLLAAATVRDVAPSAAVATPSAEFTTKTYRRAIHGRGKR